MHVFGAAIGSKWLKLTILGWGIVVTSFGLASPFDPLGKCEDRCQKAKKSLNDVPGVLRTNQQFSCRDSPVVGAFLTNRRLTAPLRHTLVQVLQAQTVILSLHAQGDMRPQFKHEL